jgi:biopolymer transport protein ExbD
MSRSFSEYDAKPNLTPILDMVFQLITFFMLVINFKSASMDMSLKLPVIGSARPVDTQGQEEVLVLNIDVTGRLNVYGTVRDPEKYIPGEAQASLLAAKQKNPSLQWGDELPTIVVIRADRATPFSFVNRVVKVCQESGYRKFSLKALNREETGT